MKTTKHQIIEPLIPAHPRSSLRPQPTPGIFRMSDHDRASAVKPSVAFTSAPSCTVALKALPNAPRNEVLGWLGDTLKVKVHAPPIEGRATAVLCEFLAAELGLPRRAVTVLRGDLSRQKILRFDGLTLAELKARVKR